MLHSVDRISYLYASDSRCRAVIYHLYQKQNKNHKTSQFAIYINTHNTSYTNIIMIQYISVNLLKRHNSVTASIFSYLHKQLPCERSINVLPHITSYVISFILSSYIILYFFLLQALFVLIRFTRWTVLKHAWSLLLYYQVTREVLTAASESNCSNNEYYLLFDI